MIHILSVFIKTFGALLALGVGMLLVVVPIVFSIAHFCNGEIAHGVGMVLGFLMVVSAIVTAAKISEEG
jgi:hypothetical protein